MTPTKLVLSCSLFSLAGSVFIIGMAWLLTAPLDNNGCVVPELFGNSCSKRARTLQRVSGNLIW